MKEYMEKETYRILLCDDSTEFMAYMKKMLLESGFSDDNVLFHEFYSGEEMISKMPGIKECDLLVLDMKMKELDGNDTADKFRYYFKDATLVFCSGVSAPTIRSFEVNPYRYLSKDYTEEEMRIKLQDVVKEVKRKHNQPRIWAKSKNSDVKCKIDDILYVSKRRNGCEIYLTTRASEAYGTSILTTDIKIAELYRQLSGYGFEYAHNSYFVNLQYVLEFNKIEFTLADNTMLSLARSKEKQFKSSVLRLAASKYGEDRNV